VDQLGVVAHSRFTVWDALEEAKVPPLSSGGGEVAGPMTRTSPSKATC
jgi:hypothetical protein